MLVKKTARIKKLVGNKVTLEMLNHNDTKVLGTAVLEIQNAIHITKAFELIGLMCYITVEQGVITKIEEYEFKARMI